MGKFSMIASLSFVSFILRKQDTMPLSATPKSQWSRQKWRVREIPNSACPVSTTQAKQLSEEGKKFPWKRLFLGITWAKEILLERLQTYRFHQEVLPLMEFPKLNAKKLIFISLKFKDRARDRGKGERGVPSVGRTNEGGTVLLTTLPSWPGIPANWKLPDLPGKFQSTSWGPSPILTFLQNCLSIQHIGCYTVHIQQVNASISEQSELTEILWTEPYNLGGLKTLMKNRTKC